MDTYLLRSPAADAIISRSLYVQALSAMQAAGEYTDGLSYFQLAGE